MVTMVLARKVVVCFSYAIFREILRKFLSVFIIVGLQSLICFGLICIHIEKHLLLTTGIWRSVFRFDAIVFIVNSLVISF